MVISFLLDRLFVEGLEMATTKPERPLNPGVLRLLAQLSIGWLVFAALIPGFFLRILYMETPYVSAVVWTISLVSFFGLAAYLCKGFLKNPEVSRLMFWGVVFLLIVQAYRICVDIGLFDMVGDPLNRARALDNLISGLGIGLIGLAFLYVLIEILTSRQKLMEERERLSSEITRRETVEKDLLERETLLRGIGASALDGIVVLDDAGCIAYCNPAAEKMFGCEAGAASGKSLSLLLDPGERAESGESGDGSGRDAGWLPPIGTTTSLNMTTRDGRVLDLELSASAMESEGRRRVVCILRDATPRKQAEQEYKAILHAAMDGFLIMDRQGRIVEVNDAYCSFVGYSRDELLQMGIPDLEAKETPEETAEHLKAITEKGFDRFETRHRRKDGTTVDVEVSVNPSAPEQSDRICAFLRDITERKRFEAESREFEARIQYAQKLESLGVLAGGIAHDFNNILQIILGNANMIEQHGDNIALSQKYVRNVKRAVERACSLTGQMLAYSGRRGGVLQSLDLGNIVCEIVEILQSSISKKITIKPNLLPDLPPIDADPAQVEQVIMNLVLNATEALDKELGGAVTISTMVLHCDADYLIQSRALYKAPEGHYVCLEVADTGCGMDSDTLEKLFEPFYTTKFTGRGLGMSAVLGIMSAHHGAIMVNSAPGRGTVIRALFPPSPSPTSNGAGSEEEIPISSTRGGNDA